MALQSGDKIPGSLDVRCHRETTNLNSNSLRYAETSEDISPYATFQLSEASTLVQPPMHAGPANTLLHSFMYHERALQEGCASPPPPAVLREYAQNTMQYYNIVGFP